MMPIKPFCSGSGGTQLVTWVPVYALFAHSIAVFRNMLASRFACLPLGIDYLERPLGTFPNRRAHWELGRDQITQGIARMGAKTVGTIQIPDGITIGIVFPRDLF